MNNTLPNPYWTRLAYIAYLAAALLLIGLGLNFIFLTPAFMPLKLDKWLVGLVFLGYGSIKLILLLRFGSGHRWTSFLMGLSIFFFIFWAGATTYDFFARSLTSLQLPIFVFGNAVFAFLWLLVPFIKPPIPKNGANGK